MSHERKIIPPLGIGERSVFSQALIDHLIDFAPGQFVSYEDLSKVAGVDVKQCRWFLTTARNRLERDERIVFEAVPGRGVVRKDDSGIISVSMRKCQGIRTAARRARDIARCSEPEKLSRDEKSRRLAIETTSRVVLAVSKPKRLKELEVKMQDATKPLPLKECFESLAKD